MFTETTSTEDASSTFTPVPVESTTAAQYRSILQRRIDEGARRASEVIAVIQRDQPRDQIVRTRAVRFETGPSPIRVRIGDDTYSPTDFALGQIAGRAGVPPAYLRELAAPTASSWQHELAVEILRRHHDNAGDGRLLVRSVRGQVRGWLSDRYRRLDARPLVDALAAEANTLGAIPVDGTATETRVALKLILPTILEPIPGEFLVYGAEWSTSDYGNGTHSFRTYAIRIRCLNGLTGEDLLKQVHLGSRLSEHIEFSERTHRLDTAASVSALRDIVRSTFTPNARDSLMTRIREAHERAMTKVQLTSATKTLPKLLQKSVVDAFDSPDIINLPEGNTAWRASNAISWIARNTQDSELRLDLERTAGSLV
jgi:hypothetical protein